MSSSASNLAFPIFCGIVSASFYVFDPIFSSKPLQYQFILLYRSRKTRRCPGLCECLSFARLHFRHQCYSSRGVLFFVGLVFGFTILLYLLFVCVMSRSICVASTVSFSRALWWVSMFPMRSISSELSQLRTSRMWYSALTVY